MRADHRALAVALLALAGCAQLLGLSDLTPAGDDDAGGGMPDARRFDGMPRVDSYRPPDAFLADALPPGTMVDIPGGSFMMGCVADPDCGMDEAPAHMVTLSPYRIDATEVTQSAWEACVAAGMCAVPTCDYSPTSTPDLPVVCIDHAQAEDYCTNWIGVRLPTEAEWEFAARGTDDRIYPWGNGVADCTLANFSDCGGAADVVGSRPGGASPFGALDMAGNVWEWVKDHYDAGYYAISPATDPQGPVLSSNYVTRGGSFADSDRPIRASNRNSDPGGRDNLGFRCATTP